MPDAILYSLLTSNATVTDYVGTRISPDIADEDSALPYIVMHNVSETHTECMSGSSGQSVARMQINCYAETPDEADAISEAVRLAIQGYRGNVGTTFVQGVLMQDGGGGRFREQPDDGSQGCVYITHADYMVWLVEERPS